MVREVDMVNYYLPPYMQEYNEPVAALRAEEPEFTLAWKATDRVLLNKFISTADEYSISRYEKMLNIYPEETDSLELRRLRVQNKWSNAIPYTIRTLNKKISELCGADGYNLELDYDRSEITIIISLKSKQMKDEVEFIADNMIPVNLKLNVILLYNTNRTVKNSKKTNAELRAYTHHEIREHLFEMYNTHKMLIDMGKNNKELKIYTHKTIRENIF